MLRVAVVEDNDTDKKIIMESLGRFALEENEHLNISEFHDAMDFLEQRKQIFRSYLWIFRCHIWMGLRRRGSCGNEIQRLC